jgi:NAD-dependent dihydropyrimidine dehydrogenase PreA subunit
MTVNKPIIDLEKCDRCGLCVSICKCGVLVIEDDVVKVIESVERERCTKWCNACELICPKEAIICPFDIIMEDDSE